MLSFRKVCGGKGMHGVKMGWEGIPGALDLQFLLKAANAGVC